MGDGGNVEVVVGAAHAHQRRRKSCRHQGFQVSCWTGALTIGCKPKKSRAVRGGTDLPKLKNCVLRVWRFLANGQLGLAKPCVGCQKITLSDLNRETFNTNKKWQR